MVLAAVFVAYWVKSNYIARQTEKDYMFLESILSKLQNSEGFVEVSSVYPEDWQWVCLIGDYESVEEALGFKDALYHKGDFKFERPNHYFTEGYWGYAFVKNDYSINFFKFYDLDVVNGETLPREWSNGWNIQERCHTRENSWFGLNYHGQKPVLFLISKF